MAGVDVYTAPRAKKINRDFVYSDPTNPIAGWVQLGFMVDENGKPFEVTVIRSTGNKKLEDAAAQSIERSVFEPASINGKPVEGGSEMKYVFMEDERSLGVDADFSTAYRKSIKAIGARDRPAADAAMKSLVIRNLYEDSMFGLVSYDYASKWGDELQQLEAIRRALAFDTGGPYLRFSTLHSALLTCLRLELSTHEYAEALDTWKRVQQTIVDKRELAPFVTSIADVDKLRSNDAAYGIPGQITDHGWHLHLFKRHFRIEAVEGHLTQVKLRCERKHVFFAFDATQQYEVPGEYGKCSIELEGQPGTKFQFVQL